jgi:CrcB protein
MLFAIALGGALGSVVRYLLGTLIAARTSGFPWGTLVINVTGSLLLGFFFRSSALALQPPALRAALTVGFCGGYTTFSTFSYETLALVQAGSYARAGAYVVGSVVLSVSAAVAGAALARVLHTPA